MKEKTMCYLCDESGDEPVGCQDCGCLICFDIEDGDDILRPAYVTASGDLFCDRCGPEYDREEDDYGDDPSWQWPGYNED